MDFKKVKIEIYIPEEYTDKLREALNNIGALGVGNYDNVMSVTKITGYWRPLKGANPFDGEVDKISKAPEDKVEFSTDIKNVENIIKVMKEVHPYEEPVMNIIPLINDRFDIGLNY
ncbi:cytochrome C biogenesis protein [Brachyspira sp. G79]|uniref:cytochrome C biogenesis protein n=1 Tax=Brachyspira sp. G79 TaxID=1358104 RepID=UPI000BBB87DE|nr:cytochrome C biogenesis protein [Brachyspira sp. G79]PCG19784.1 cytochrome C biogenesis protein [Brachyspira sp. G79]